MVPYKTLAPPAWNEIKWNLVIFYWCYLNNKTIVVRITSLLTNVHLAILEAEIRFYLLHFLSNIRIIFVHETINSQSAVQLSVVMSKIPSWTLFFSLWNLTSGLFFRAYFRSSTHKSLLHSKRCFVFLFSQDGLILKTWLDCKIHFTHSVCFH